MDNHEQAVMDWTHFSFGGEYRPIDHTMHLDMVCWWRLVLSILENN